MKDKENLGLNQELFRSQLMQTLASLDTAYRQVLHTTDIMPNSLNDATQERYQEFNDKVKVSIKKVYHEVTVMREASLVLDGLFDND